MKQNKTLFIEAKDVLIKLIDTLNYLSYDEYVQPLPMLSDSSIGQHTRHIIELFQQLNKGYEINRIDYDNRKRNLKIQSNISYAVECMAEIISSLEKENKQLSISTVNNNNETMIETNYFRELMYNIEHCIHHQAIIKIGLLLLGKENLNDNFGIAKSTLLYRQQCAQ
jgi:uncharacterized damage-inducible protein DinB